MKLPNKGPERLPGQTEKLGPLLHKSLSSGFQRSAAVFSWEGGSTMLLGRTHPRGSLTSFVQNGLKHQVWKPTSCAVCQLFRSCGSHQSPSQPSKHPVLMASLLPSSRPPPHFRIAFCRSATEILAVALIGWIWAFKGRIVFFFCVGAPGAVGGGKGWLRIGQLLKGGLPKGGIDLEILLFLQVPQLSNSFSTP